MNQLTFVPFYMMFIFFMAAGFKFFIRGKPNLSWLLTLLPFIGMAIGLAFVASGNLPLAFVQGSDVQLISSIVGQVLVCLAILIFGATLGTHREPIPMWHQVGDKPSRVVTWGMYKFIRHPFYTSYYVYFTGCVIFAPSPVILAIACYGYFILNHTAEKEERELCREFGDEYTAFISRTGRFFPPL